MELEVQKVNVVQDSVNKDGQELAPPPTTEMEVALEDEIEQVGFSLQPGLSSVSESASVGQHKKARLSSDLDIFGTPDQLANSLDLHHKVATGSKQQQDVLAEGGGEGVHTNMFGVNYIIWFNLRIE